MSLPRGARLASYEIIDLIGSGGMGEVYRARDLDLGRDVAIKILPASFHLDPDRLRRFKQEAHATAALNHPNILSIFYVGQQDSAPFLVSELLEGQTLRQVLQQGTLSMRKALDYAVQIGRGLAAAHAKGIIHRDLKPENIFITRDGRAKILDFGLAKLILSSDGKPDANTLTEATGIGTVLGTAGYMSPEQIRGETVDHRSDIFSFGLILYEMLSGQRAFQRKSGADTMAAILREDPAPFSPQASIPPALERIVQHCLEKEPSARFQSMQDVVFDLESLSSASGSSPRLETAVIPNRTKFLKLAFAALVLLLAAGGGLLLGRRLFAKPDPVWHRLTYNRGDISAARFAPDGHTVIYSAKWRTDPNELFTTRPESPESRTLAELPSALLAVSTRGEILALQKMLSFGVGFYEGTLVRLPLEGGAPREVLRDTRFADWARNATDLLVVYEQAGKSVLEFPLGHRLLESGGIFAHPRLSPDGTLIALFEYSDISTDSGSISVIDMAGKRRILSEGWSDLTGLAWSPDGKEIWFTGSRSSGAGTLNVVSLRGQVRLITKASADLVLHDVAPDGRVLLGVMNWRGEIYGAFHGLNEQDLTWFDFSVVAALSDDGNLILFHEAGEAGGPNWSAYMRRTDGSAPARLGDGICASISPDQKWAACTTALRSNSLALVPLGVGTPKALDIGKLEVAWMKFFPDGKSLMLEAAAKDGPLGGYVVTLDGKVTPVTPEGVSWIRLSPSGHSVAVSVGSDQIVIYPIDGGKPYPVPGVLSGDYIAGWSLDEQSLYVYHATDVPARVFRLNLKTGKREFWKTLAPSDRAGVSAIEPVIIAPDGKSYAYGLNRRLSDLFVVEGLK